MGKLEDEIKSSFSSEQHKLIINVIYTANWLKNKRAYDFVGFGITHQQYNILRILRGSHPGRLTMQDVKTRMLEKTPNTTRLTDKLLGQGLIERIRCDKDRRVVFVEITQKGLSLLSKIDEKSKPLFDKLIAQIDPSQAVLLNELLDEWRDNDDS